MPFGDTAKKVKKLSNTAENLYGKVNELVDQVKDLRERVERTGDQIDAMERELAEQRAIVETLAEREGVDIEAVVADVEPPSERHADAGGETADGDGSDGSTGDGSTGDGSTDDSSTGGT